MIDASAVKGRHMLSDPTVWLWSPSSCQLSMELRICSLGLSVKTRKSPQLTPHLTPASPGCFLGRSVPAVPPLTPPLSHPGTEDKLQISSIPHISRALPWEGCGISFLPLDHRNVTHLLSTTLRSQEPGTDCWLSFPF